MALKTEDPMRVRVVAIPAAMLLASLAFRPAEPPAEGNTVVVKMVDKSATEFAFEPANVVVKPGDVVRFVQTVATPHNVEFKDVPAGATLGVERMGPFLVQPNDTYEVPIGAGFKAGTYKFVCTPHEMMGMMGSITVEAGR